MDEVLKYCYAYCVDLEFRKCKRIIRLELHGVDMKLIYWEGENTSRDPFF